LQKGRGFSGFGYIFEWEKAWTRPIAHGPWVVLAHDGLWRGAAGSSPEDGRNGAPVDESSPRPSGNGEGAIGVLTMDNFGRCGNTIRPPTKETGSGYSSSLGQRFGVGEMELRVGKAVVRNRGTCRALL
jgi:hypothetical protein